MAYIFYEKYVGPDNGHSIANYREYSTIVWDVSGLDDYNFIKHHLSCALKMHHNEEIYVKNKKDYSTVVFKSLQEYKKWAENKAPDECLTTTITFKKNPYVEYSWKRYNEGSKIERFSLEIYDEDTKELLVEKKYQIPAKALDFISAHLCPSDPKYNPTSICADRNCRATINDVDVTDYFIYKEHTVLDITRSSCSAWVQIKKKVNNIDELL